MGGAEIQNEGERVNSSKRKSPFPGSLSCGNVSLLRPCLGRRRQTEPGDF